MEPPPPTTTVYKNGDTTRRIRMKSSRSFPTFGTCFTIRGHVQEKNSVTKNRYIIRQRAMDINTDSTSPR